ncbi:MAG TPA: competence/damage-inducible protein A, partial [Nitrospiraceae bacterium]
MPTVKAPSPLICETIAIGAELLSGGRLDSNSIVLAEELATIGVQVRYKSAVGDVRSDIAQVLAQAVKRAGIVLMTGGLGPTVDDCTREAVSQATGRRLRRHKAALEGMRARLAEWQRVPTRSQMRQGMLPTGATVLSNSLGSAPGFCLTWRRAFIACLPGVPEEMKLMMSEEVMPLLRAMLIESGHTPRPILRKEFHTFGLPEAEVDARLKDVMPKDLPVDLGLLASPTG